MGTEPDGRGEGLSSGRPGKTRTTRSRMDAFLKTGKLGAGGAEPSGRSASKKSAQRPTAPVPWVEKYRPRTVDDVAYQDEVVSVLKKSLEGADLPNLLFYGPPGTGKTSTILAAARDLFGDMYKQRILELNASDERGIQVVRDKIKHFAQLTASGKRPDGRPCPPFKIVILDEADSMTRDAQSALRRTMEKEGKSTKFCLICNYVSRIIEPLTSRCAKFRFKPLSNDILVKRLNHISEQESVKVSEDALEALIETSEGDLRRAITTLQSAARLKSPDKPEVGKIDVCEVAGVVPEKWVNGIIDVCSKSSFPETQDFVDKMIAEGFSGSQLIGQLHDKVVSSAELSDSQKSAICEALAVNDGRLLDGASEYLQVVDLCTVMMKQMNAVQAV